MRAILVIGLMAFTAACAEQPAYQDPAPATHAKGAGSAPASPCRRSDYPAGAAGDTAYTNCIIQS